MRHRASKRFWKAYQDLNPSIQRSADKAFELLKRDSSHPSLQFKKIGKFYSIRIDLIHRALALKDKEGYIWVWIGNHDEYEKFIHRG